MSTIKIAVWYVRPDLTQRTATLSVEPGTKLQEIFDLALKQHPSFRPPLVRVILNGDRMYRGDGALPVSANATLALLAQPDLIDERERSLVWEID